MNKKIQFFSLILICLAIVSCASWDDGFDDPINIRTINTTHGEDAKMQQYFRYYINRVTGRDYVEMYSPSRTARFTLRIDVLEKEKEKARRHRLHIPSPGSRRKFNPAYYYNYKIKIDLIDNKNGGIVWTWEPAKWKTFKTKHKSIKWLAKYSAKRMVKEGLFSSLYLR